MAHEESVLYAQLCDPANAGIFAQWYAVENFQGVVNLFFRSAGVPNPSTNTFQVNLLALRGG